jgi:hypothetical protein
MALVSGTHITVAVCLAFIPTVVHVVWRCCETHLLEHRPYGHQELGAHATFCNRMNLPLPSGRTRCLGLSSNL